jgi:hypothetical protein
MSNTRDRIRVVGILTLAGTPSYVACFLWHICMDGHMQHGPYPLYHWISDFWWMACFASVFVFSLKMNAKRRVLSWAGSIFLILSRIGLGSGGGGNVLIELPLLVAMDIYAIKYVIRPERLERHGEQDTPPSSCPPSQLPAPPEVQRPD